MAGLTVLVESPLRRKELAFYCFPRAIQIGWNILKKKKIVRSVKYGEFAFISCAISTLFYFYQCETSAIQKSHYRFLHRILGSN